MCFASLSPPGEVPDAELLVFAFEFASLVFTEEPDRQWLRRRFSVFNDILRETWVFQEIMQEGEEKGLKKGLEELRLLPLTAHFHEHDALPLAADPR